MKKSTINYILYGVMACLVLAICILLVKIAGRTRYIDTTESATIQEAPIIQETVTITESSSTQPAEKETTQTAPSEDTVSNVLRGHTSDKVKVREQPSLEARVLEIVDEGYSFTILEILSTGWTKISYEEGEAYISSAYVVVEN